MESYYSRYRGKCKSMCEDFITEHSGWEVVRGWYTCPFFGEEEHWWVQKDGEIHDPSVWQYPSHPRDKAPGDFPVRGLGHYEKFTGTYPCMECGKNIDEATATHYHGVCSGECYGAMVGVPIS